MMGPRSRAAVVALLALIALAATWWALGGAGGLEAGSPASARAASGRASRLVAPGSVGEGGRRESVEQLSSPREYIVRGRVLDQAGEPVPGMRVFVGAQADPFAREDAHGWGNLEGQVFPTDERGAFRIELPGPGRVHVAAHSREFWVRSLEGKSSLWVDPPRGDIELEVQTLPYGTLVVRVLDVTAQRELDEFKVSLAGIDPSEPRDGVYLHGYASAQTTTGRVEMKWAVPYEDGLEVAVSLIKPAIYSDRFSRLLGAVGLEDPENVSRTVRVRAGETREVTLEIRFDQSAEGLVVDELGLPIADAVVFFGTQADARGDEPFKPFDTRRVSGTRSDAAGRYELSGSGPSVSVWHPDYSPATVPADDAARIVLQRRGRITGRVPRVARSVAVEVLLDFRRAVVAASDGSFAFDAVEAGTHALVMPGTRVVLARVEPGSTTDVSLEDTLDHVRFVLLEGGQPRTAPFQGALVGLGSVSSLLEVLADAGECEWGDVVAGEYALLSSGGHASRVTIDGPEVRVELGSSELVVRGPPGLEPLLLPVCQDGNDFLRLMAPRISRRIPSTGELRFGPLSPGLYALIERARNRTRLVNVQGAETVIELP